jgi:hypothetical protein
MQIDRGGKLAIADIAPVRCADDTVGNAERIGRRVKPLGRLVEQKRAGFRADEPDRRAAVFDRLATRGPAFVWRARGVAGNHLDAGSRQVELLGGDLLQRGEDALPQLDLAGDRGRAVGVDAQPGVEHAIVGEASQLACRLAGEDCRLTGGEARGEREGEDERARPLTELPPSQDRVLLGWLAAAITLSAMGICHVTSGDRPTIQYGILLPILIGGLMIWRSETTKRVIAAVPQNWLVGVQFYRALGAIFLLLYTAGKLPGLFAWPAAVGDMAIGLSAPRCGSCLCASASQGRRSCCGVERAWSSRPH